MSDAVVNPNIIDAPGANSVIASAVTLIIFSSLAVPIRFWARRHQRLDFLMDDWLTLPALIINLILGGLTIWSWSNHSLGYATPTPPKGADPLTYEDYRIQTGKKVTYALEFMQAISLACTKISCLCFYRRIFYTGKKNAFHWVSVSLIGISIAWGIAFGFSFMFDCKTQFSALWTTIYTINTECQIFLPVEIAFGVSDIVIDTAVFILPFAMVSRLKMSLSKKIAIAGMFLLGGFAIVSCIMRTAVLLNAVITVTRSYQKTKTGANNGTVAAATVWGCIESCATLTASCLPAIYVPVRSAIRRYCGKPEEPQNVPPPRPMGSPRRWPKVSQLWTLRGIDRMDETNDSIPMVTAVATTTSERSENTAQARQQGSGKHGSVESVRDGQIRVTHTVEQVSHRI